MPASISRPFARCLAAAAALATLVGLGCSSSSTSASPDGGLGFVAGPQDDHCSVPVPMTQVVNPASCNPPPTSPDAGAADDDGGADDGPAAPEFGDTMYNAEGDDDDCKYHVKASVTPGVTEGAKLTFTAEVTKLAPPGGPATGAIVNSQGDGIAIEGFLNDNNSHVLPNTTPMTFPTETPAGSGIYKISPVVFDASGRWVVRFHFFATCDDGLDDSPHGHAAFYFDVP